MVWMRIGRGSVSCPDDLANAAFIAVKSEGSGQKAEVDSGALSVIRSASTSRPSPGCLLRRLLWPPKQSEGSNRSDRTFSPRPSASLLRLEQETRCSEMHFCLLPSALCLPPGG